jgi:hypothetical protein
MTPIKPDSPVVRETAAIHKTRPLVVELHPKLLAIWPKGTQQWLTVDYETVFALAQKLEARRKP